MLDSEKFKQLVKDANAQGADLALALPADSADDAEPSSVLARAACATLAKIYGEAWHYLKINFADTRMGRGWAWALVSKNALLFAGTRTKAKPCFVVATRVEHIYASARQSGSGIDVGGTVKTVTARLAAPVNRQVIDAMIHDFQYRANRDNSLNKSQELTAGLVAACAALGVKPIPRTSVQSNSTALYYTAGRVADYGYVDMSYSLDLSDMDRRAVIHSNIQLVGGDLADLAALARLKSAAPLMLDVTIKFDPETVTLADAATLYRDVLNALGLNLDPAAAETGAESVG